MWPQPDPWVAPPPVPPPRPAWWQRLARPAVAGAAVVAAAGAVALIRAERHPAWDERIRDLVGFVEDARGGPFDHPVEVRFLTAEEYSEATRVEAEDLDEEDALAIADDVAVLRALGLVEGDLDLLGATNEITDAGTLAFYDPLDEVVVVRGTEVTTDVAVTLVHELVHAWQDQRYDVDDLYLAAGDEATAVRGLLEGDAIRIEQEYVFRRLDRAEREEYFATNAAGVEAAEAELADVPAIVRATFDAPYLLGIPLVLTLAELGGDALDAAFEDPPSSDEQLMDVLALLEDDDPVEVVPPPVPDGAEPIDDPDDGEDDGARGFGALGLYLTLAERLDVAAALDAADGWGGDAMTRYRLDGATCLRVALVADTPEDGTELHTALAAWAAAMPAGVVTVTPAAGEDPLRFDACDPGPDAVLGVTGRSGAALGVLTARAFVLRDLVTSGVDERTAACVGRRAALSLTPEQADDVFGTIEDGTLAAAARAALATCS